MVVESNMSEPAIYYYTISGNFPQGIRVDQLAFEIRKNDGISKLYMDVTSNGDSVLIKFEEILSPAEEEVLHEIVLLHQPLKLFEVKSINFNEVSNNTSIYEVVFGFIFDGRQKLGDINMLRVLARKDPSVTSYKIRVYDSYNKCIISETENLSNDNIQLIDMSLLSKPPFWETEWEIQVKTTGASDNGFAYVNGIVLVHEVNANM